MYLGDVQISNEHIWNVAFPALFVSDIGQHDCIKQKQLRNQDPSCILCYHKPPTLNLSHDIGIASYRIHTILNSQLFIKHWEIKLIENPLV